jgi:tetratricopeptide (TPR) repeat protein
MGRELKDFRCWKKVAKNLGLTSQEIDHIKSEAKSSRNRAWKMLILWHSKVRRAIGVSHHQMAVQQMEEQLQKMTPTAQTDPVPQQSGMSRAERCAGYDPSQLRQGWHCVLDAVESHPIKDIIDSVVDTCAVEWYRLGLKLNLTHGQILDTTDTIPTVKGKLQAIVDRKSREDGIEVTLKTLLNACNQIMPLASETVLQDLGIDSKYHGLDKELFELADEVGVFWKELALDLGLRGDEVDSIEKEASTNRDRAFKMLRHLHAKTSKKSVFNVDDVRARLGNIKEKQYDAQLKKLILLENAEDDKKVCGREEELERIFRKFWGNHHRLAEIPQFCLQVVSGLGGIGKSSVALKYARQWKDWYGDGVLYLNAESYASLYMSVRKYMKHFNLSYTGTSLEEDNQTLLQHVYEKRKVLLIYDGADNLDFLSSYLPSNAVPVHVLVTTRCGSHSLLNRANQVIFLRCLKTHSAVKALLAWRERPDEELVGAEAQSASRLVSEAPLEGLPLPIAHAGTYMEKAELDCCQYYDLLKSRQETLAALALDMEKFLHYFNISSLKEMLHSMAVYQPNDLAKCPVEEIESVAVKFKDRQMLLMARKFLLTTDHVHLTWQMDIERVKETDNVAMELLFFVSFLASKNIPERLVRPLACSNAFSYHFAKCLSSLKSHTLIDVSVDNEGYHIDVHPLVQATVFERLLTQTEDVQAHKLETLCQHLLSLLPRSHADIEASLREDSFMALIPHLYATAEKVGVCPLIQESWSLLSLACRVAIIMKDVNVAVNLCHQNMKLFSVSEYPYRQFHAFYCMGQAYELLSNPQVAEGHYKSALSVIDTFGVDQLSHEYGLVLGSLALCYSHQQRFEEAEDLYLRQLQLIRERPQDNRLEIASVLANLALNYMDSGQIEKALRAYEEVLEMKEDDPATPPLSLSATLCNMGRCLMENRQFEKALPVLERALSIMRQHLPIHHYDLAQGVRELSVCCGELGYVQRAMDLANEAVSMARNALPDGHPKMAFYLGQLASCHGKSGRTDEAINCYKQCIEIEKKNLPATGHNLCTSLNNLGLLYYNNGMLEEARKMYEECLSIQRSIFPAQHPDIGITLYNLGCVYKDSNDILRATELFKESLYIYENSLSRTHPLVTNVLVALGYNAFKLERYGEALQFYERLHDILMETAPRSEKMAIVCSNMGMCYVNLGQLNSAEEWFSKTLEIQRTILPQGHDSISQTENMLHRVWQMKFGH